MRKLILLFSLLSFSIFAFPQTANIGLAQPATGADAGTWGAILNNNAGIIDSINGPVCYPALQSGADICAQINACYLNSRTNSVNAGIIDARVGYAIASTQACNSNPFAGANKAGQLLLGSYTIAVSATWITPQRKFEIIGMGVSSPLGTAGTQSTTENTVFTPCLASGNPTGCTAALAQTNNLLFIDDNPSGNCPGTLASCRQHGPFSAYGSGLTGAGNYYAIVALGGQDTVGTCGSGPVGADWKNNAFGGSLQRVAFDVHGVAGVIAMYTGNEQEHFQIHDVGAYNYGGSALGYEGAGLFLDRNAHNVNDTCSSGNSNGGPSHDIIEHYFADPSGAVAAAGQGYALIMEGANPTQSQNQGLGQYTFMDMTLRGLQGSKSHYGIWIDNYIDGSIMGVHCENMTQDCIYLQNATNWLIANIDDSAVQNAVVELGTGTNNNVVINANGGAGGIPGVEDDVFGCPGAFGATPPCELTGSTGFAPSNIYIQGGFPLPNLIQFANSASGPTMSGGTGAPTGSCTNGSIWVRSDNGSGSSMYVCKNSGWSAIN